MSFHGLPHKLKLKVDVKYVVIDRHGVRVPPRHDPFEDGFTLLETNDELSELEAAYVEAFKIMAPIRDVLMYLPESVSREEWAELTRVLDELEIGRISIMLGSVQDWILSNEDALAYAQLYLGQGSIQPLAAYLYDSERALKCRLFDEAGFKEEEYCS